MKTLLKSALVATIVGIFAIPSSAGNFVTVPVNAQDTVVKKDTLVKKDVPETMLLAQAEVTYSKIEVSEVPEAVAKAVAAKYEGYTIDEASKGTDNSYKLVIKKEEAKLTIYFTGSGEFVKEETASTTETILG